MIQSFGNSIYGSQAQAVGNAARAKELVAQLREVQKKLRHPLVSAKHIGLNVQAFIVNLHFANHEASNVELVILNPTLISTTAPLVSGLEDDLSLPRLEVSIERPKQIEVQFLDGNLTERTVAFSDLAARWILHGIEQLNGVSIIDKLNLHRQRSVQAHLNRIAERKIEPAYKLEYDS